jgi:hypothetical protein
VCALLLQALMAVFYIYIYLAPKHVPLKSIAHARAGNVVTFSGLAREGGQTRRKRKRPNPCFDHVRGNTALIPVGITTGFRFSAILLERAQANARQRQCASS